MEKQTLSSKNKENLKPKNTIAKFKNSLGEFNSTMDMTEEKVSALKDQLIEIIQSEKQREKNTGGRKTEQSLRLVR